jgi:uncharacterized repeat protein (TIGR01451 family)
VPPPVVGTASGPCGVNTGETSPDVFWRSLDENTPPGAVANVTITNLMARSTAVLVLPPGAQVTYARLYWAAPRYTPISANDTQVTLERAGVFSTMVTADVSTNVSTTAGLIETFYQSTADVTDLVRTNGPGAYRVSGIDTKEFANLAHNRLFIAWSMVVFYRLDTDPQRNLALFDGLDPVQPGQQVDITLTGFLVPNAGFDAKLGVVAYEGDSTLTGDQLRFNGTLLGGAAGSTNPTDNFFNSTRSHLGTPVSNAGDLPQLTGGPRSMAGVDMDVIAVTPLLQQGDTMAMIRASSTSEFFMTGVFVTSISTFKPDFTSTNKTYVNLANRPDGAVRPGDTLEYTVTTTNTGNDPGVGVVLTDMIPAGLTYVPGSIVVSAGANAGAKTDQSGDDQAEYNGSTRTVTVRLGAGANATMGGVLAVNASTTVKFRVTVDASAMGVIANQAVVTASGMSGAPSTMYPSDGDPATPGPQGTRTPIDQCLTDADCAAPTPFCRNGAAQHPWICVECRTRADCTTAARPVCDAVMNACRACSGDGDCTATPATPACHGSGACTQCSMTNTTLCTGTTPRCNVSVGMCVGCTTDADCSGATPVCDATSKTCRACRMDSDCTNPALPACQTAGALAGACGECSATNRTRCMGATPVCDAAAARCVECNTNADCPVARPVCETATHVCRGCATDADCGGATPYCQAMVCVGCRTSADCTGARPICAPSAGGARSCVACSSDAECMAKDPRLPACHASGPLAGACAECSATNRTLCMNQKPECLVNLGFCGCSSTDGDSECGGMMSGIVCNAPVGICIPGCSTAPSRNLCPAGQTCSRMDGAVGVCVAGMCNGDGDCMAPTPRCDTAASPRACVQCLADGDCRAPAPVCDGARKICVECTPANTNACSPSVSGSRCLPNSTCGCQSDADCGGMTSGRVCDSGIEKCSPGCRGTGGNGCPPGFVCTSSTNAIGRCVPFGTPLDGGTPDAPVDAAADAPADTAADTAPDLAADLAADRAPDAPADAAADRAADRAVDAVTSDRAALDLPVEAAAREAGVVDTARAPLDAAVAVDARAVSDAVGAPPDDAAAPPAGVNGYVAGGGCRCDVGGSRGAGGSALLGALAIGAAFGLARRRRRRR